MKSKYTVIIGVPAHNEGRNIELLLKSILKQKLNNIVISKIIIVSDGSTDDTEKKVKLFKDPRVVLIVNNKRLGLNKSQNLILRKSNADILVFLDGDILPTSNYFIQNLVSPILVNKNIGIVAGDNIAVFQKTFFGSLIKFSHELKIDIFKQINRCNNVYLCFGRARAFSKSFYSNFNWPEDVPEDAYSYFECIHRNLSFYHTDKASVYFSVPRTLNDYIKQSLRFFSGRKKLEKFFSPNSIKREYSIPFLVKIRIIAKNIIYRPGYLSAYMILVLAMRIISFKTRIESSKYEPSNTTKSLYE